MINEAVTVPNKIYINNLSTYKVTLTDDVPPWSGHSDDGADDSSSVGEWSYHRHICT
jgi:hypothetical protein